MVEGLLFKLHQNRVFVNLLSVATDILNNRTKRVVFKGQISPWSNNEDGVPQDSVFSLLLFLIYINDLSDNQASNPNLFADNPSLFYLMSRK